MSLSNRLFWELISETGELSYLFGSMHLPYQDFYKLPEAILPYVKQCKCVGTEINFNESHDHELDAYTHIAKLENTPFFKHAKSWNKIAQVCSDYFEMDISAYKNAKPMVLLNAIAVQILTEYKHVISIDEWIYNQAKDLNLDCIGLENTINHYEYLNRIDVDEQWKQVLKLCKNVKKAKQEAKNLVQYYLEQNIHQLYIKSKKTLAQYRHSFLYERNEVMARKIAEVSSSTSLFACFGAAHLAGNFGILALLKRRAFKIKPVYINIH